MVMNCIIRADSYPWTHKGETHVCGFILDKEEYIDSTRFLACTEIHSSSFEDFHRWCSGLNGQFAIIVKKPGEVWMASSPVWSYPVFYTFSGKQILISDDPGQCLPNEPVELAGKEVILHFLQFCATPAGTTLIGSLSQLRPGEIVRFKPHEKPTTFITGTGDYRTREPATPEELKTLLTKIFSRYCPLFRNKQILLPLTRGYDSRLLACLLKEFGINEVICATWGRESMPERMTAEKVARKLGFPYIFIRYDEELTRGFEEDPEIIRFMHYCGHFSSMPYLQDYFAIRKMKAEGIVGPDTLAIPGLSGDFIRGSHLYYELKTQDDPEIAREIMTMFGTAYVRGKEEKKRLLDAMLHYHFEELGSLPGRFKFDLWDYFERQCKFIGNSSRIYSWFGIQDYTLLLDRELVTFFLSLPESQRFGAKLYNDTLENLIFKPAGVGFDLKKAVNPSRKHSLIKEKIIESTPAFLRKMYYPLNDDVYYREITGRLMKSSPGEDYRHPVKSHFYNCYMAQWYLQWIKSQQKTGQNQGTVK